MPSVVLVDTTSTQTISGTKTITSPIINTGNIDLDANPVNALDAATKAYVDSVNSTPVINGSLHASVASNILTLHLRTLAGSVPSSTDVVRINFRSSTAGDGAVTTRSVTSATTMTFASGSELGTLDATAARIWVGLIDNAGTVELCAWNALTLDSSSKPTALTRFRPGDLVTTTAEGSGTADSAGVLYSTTARSNVPFVVLGYIEATEASKGIWATAPSKIHTWSPGTPLVGDEIGFSFAYTLAFASGTTAFPDDDTIPQNTEGVQFITVDHTPKAVQNILEVSAELWLGQTTSTSLTMMALFQDSTANALDATVAYHGAAPTSNTQRLDYLMRAGTTSATTMKIRAGNPSGSTVSVNGTNATRKLGGIIESSMWVKEFMA